MTLWTGGPPFRFVFNKDKNKDKGQVRRSPMGMMGSMKGSTIGLTKTSFLSSLFGTRPPNFGRSPDLKDLPFYTPRIPRGIPLLNPWGTEGLPLIPQGYVSTNNLVLSRLGDLVQRLA